MGLAERVSLIFRCGFARQSCAAVEPLFRNNVVTRRHMLAKLGGTASLLMLGRNIALPALGKEGTLSADEDAFLEELERASFRFFWECAEPSSGLVKDRSTATGNDRRPMASIAATGFGLTALCVASERKWDDPMKIRDRVVTTLEFLKERLPHEHGFFFHFVHWQTGERFGKCELSSIDTAILLCGVLTCRQYFADEKIQRLSRELYDRVDWLWMMQGGKHLLHGWKPESGFLKSKWDAYCEHMMLYLLAIGANEHPIPAQSWHEWRRPIYEYANIRYITVSAPLFIHQYSHAWVDFRGKKDRYANYFENSVLATRAHRTFCLDLRKRFPHFSENLWGISASDSQKGYVAWGGPPEHGPLDGTLVPCAPAGSLPFQPKECLLCLREMREKFGSQIWARYGFIDAFNPHTRWFAPDVIGIDVGITLLMAENLRTGLLWRLFMKNEEIVRAMSKAGFSNTAP